MIMARQSDSQAEMDARSIEDFMTIEEATDFSGYTEQYLRRMSRAGKIEAIKRGHFWLVNRHSLEAYMERAADVEDKRFGPRAAQE
jgi:excisionase family DNA binding protein